MTEKDDRPSSESAPGVDKIAALTADLEQAKNDYLYLRADFDNYRKSVIKERSDLIKYGSERVFRELLEVLDNFDRARRIELTPDSFSDYQEGISLTALELKKMLENFGVKEIDCIEGAFDPSLHEAMGSEESDRLAPGHIVRIFKRGFMIHDKVLRPAQVVVSKEPQKT